MAEFLEERLSVDVRLGASYEDEYQVEVTRTNSGAEYRRLVHPIPVRRFRFSWLYEKSALYASVLSLYHRAYGRYAGFRVRCLDDFSTAAEIGTPTALDETLALVSTNIYQLQKAYGAGATPLAIGLPKRTIFKPVSGTTKIGIGGVNTTIGWTVATTTGRVTFAANKSKAITGISKAASAVITVGSHSYVAGESVHISGVVGMTQINGLRGLITAADATTITVAINSTLFGTYTSGGTAQTNPQSGEAVTGGCEFDIPARFDGPLAVQQNMPGHREIDNIELVELINP